MDQVSLSALLASVTAYGATVTKIVDAFRKLDTKTNPNLKWLWNVLPLVVGVLVATIFDISIFGNDQVGLGHVLTGLAIGAAGSGWHEVFDTLSGAAKQTHANAAATPATGRTSNTSDTT